MRLLNGRMTSVISFSLYFDQILICARIKYELEFIKAGGFLSNYKDSRIIKPNRFENEIHYIVRANFSIFKEF